MGISRFIDIGVVRRIHDRRTSEKGYESIAIEIDIDGDLHYVLATGGQLLGFVESKLSVGDVIYCEGKVRRDRTLDAMVPKNVLIKYANHISIQSLD